MKLAIRTLHTMYVTTVLHL